MKNLVFSVSTGARPPEPSTKGEPVHVLFFVKLPGCAPANPSSVFSQREINKDYHIFALFDPSNKAIFITPDPIFPPGLVAAKRGKPFPPLPPGWPPAPAAPRPSRNHLISSLDDQAPLIACGWLESGYIYKRHI